MTTGCPNWIERPRVCGGSPYINPNAAIGTANTQTCQGPSQPDIKYLLFVSPHPIHQNDRATSARRTNGKRNEYGQARLNLVDASRQNSDPTHEPLE